MIHIFVEFFEKLSLSKNLVLLYDNCLKEKHFVCELSEKSVLE